MAIKYFVWSQQEFDVKKTIADNNGKVFTVGTVIIKGTKKQFTSLQNARSSRYSDAIFYEADTSKVKYTMPSIK